MLITARNWTISTTRGSYATVRSQRSSCATRCSESCRYSGTSTLRHCFTCNSSAIRKPKYDTTPGVRKSVKKHTEGEPRMEESSPDATEVGVLAHYSGSKVSRPTLEICSRPRGCCYRGGLCPTPLLQTRIHEDNCRHGKCTS